MIGVRVKFTRDQQTVAQMVGHLHRKKITLRERTDVTALNYISYIYIYICIAFAQN